MVGIEQMKGLGICITLSPLFKHIIQIEDLALDLKNIGEAGYRGIELSISDIEDVDWDPFDRHLLENGLELITIATGLVRKVNNISLMDRDPENRKLAVERLSKMIKFIGSRDSTSKNILIGYLKGELSDDKDYADNQKIWLNDSLTELIDTAGIYNVTIVLEVINHNEVNFLYNISDGEEFVSKFNSEYLKLAVDTYHMNIDEDDISQTLKQAKAHIGYVHLSDDNRGYPGSGNINFPEIIRTLNEINYRDFLMIECGAFPDKKIALTGGYKYMSNI
jgi:sugar phosphate isomerase/epimerase